MVEIYETEKGTILKRNEQKDGCWIKITNAQGWELEPIANRYQIDYDDMKAALDEEEKSRVVLEDDYTLVLVDIPASEVQHDKKIYTTIPLGVIMTNDVIITVCSEDTPILNKFIQSHVKSFSTKKRTRFLYQILLNAMTTYQTVLRSVDNRRLDIEARIGEAMEDESDLIELHDLESTLVYFETSLRAAGMVIDRLRRYKHIPQFPEDEDLLEDVQVENRQAIEMATRKGARAFNMKNPDWFERLKKYLVDDAGIAAASFLEFPKTFAKVPRNLVDFTPQKPATDSKPTPPKMSDKQIRALMKSARR